MAIADGRWHSFGGRSIPAGRGVGNFALSHTGGNRFVGNGRPLLGRGFGGFGNGFGTGFRGRGFGGFGSGFRRGFGGCWNCGFGWGLGFDWGWGWPFWDWGFDWGWPGYWSFGWGYPGWDYPYGDAYGYSPPYPYSYGGYDDAWVWDNNSTGNYGDYTGGTATDNYSDDSVYSNAPDTDNDSNNYYNDDDEQASQSTPLANSSGLVDPEAIATVVYLKDGTALQMTTYWSSGNTLRYVNAQGGVSGLDVRQIDLQRTVDENAKHGVRFSIKPQPSTPAVAPSAPAVQSASLSKAA